MARRRAVDENERYVGTYPVERLYLARVPTEDGSYYGNKYTVTKKARIALQEKWKREKPWLHGTRGPDLTCREFADDGTTRQYSGAIKTKAGRPIKRTTIKQREQALNRFLADFGDRTLTSISRREARRWTELPETPTNAVLVAVTMFNAAVAEYDPTADEGLPSVNPFRGLVSERTGARTATHRPRPSTARCMTRAPSWATTPRTSAR